MQAKYQTYKTICFFPEVLYAFCIFCMLLYLLFVFLKHFSIISLSPDRPTQAIIVTMSCLSQLSTCYLAFQSRADHFMLFGIVPVQSLMFCRISRENTRVCFWIPCAIRRPAKTRKTTIDIRQNFRPCSRA